MNQIETVEVAAPEDYTMQYLCRLMLNNNRDKITTKKSYLAVRKLELIVSAALTLSNKRGFSAMSLRELAQESNVSMGGMYSYFNSKTDLLEMILGEVERAASTILATPPEVLKDDPEGQLVWHIETHVSLSEVMLPWFYFSYMEAKNFPYEQRRRAKETEEITEGFLLKILRAGAAEGAFSCVDPELTGALIKPLLQEWYVKRSKYRKRSVSQATYVAEVTRIVLSSLK